MAPHVLVEAAKSAGLSNLTRPRSSFAAAFSFSLQPPSQLTASHTCGGDLPTYNYSIRIATIKPLYPCQDSLLIASSHSPPFFLPLFPHKSVKLDSRETPPPLHFSPVTSDRERSSTAETTPIGTPRCFGFGFPRKSEKEKDNLFAWHHKYSGFAGNSTSYVDSTLLESDFEDSTFPLFNEPSRHLDMGSRVSPIDIATTSRLGSPRSTRTSNLTSALQSTSGNEARPTTAMDISGGPFKGWGSGFGGTASGSQYVSGAQPISMNASSREKPRRESLAGSMVTGMSWGGASVDSWIRDEYVSTE